MQQFFYKMIIPNIIIKTVERCSFLGYNHNMLMYTEEDMKEKFIRFMSGRYGMFGVDQLSWALLFAYIAVSFASGFIPNFWVRLAMRLLAISFIVYMVFRLLSRNHYSRRKENAVVKKAWEKTKAFFKLQSDRIRNIKTYRYRRCPHCKAVLQLPVPKKKGKNTVVCPKCRERFSVFTLF